MATLHSRHPLPTLHPSFHVIDKNETMKRRFLLPALAIMFLTLSRLSCEQECESDYIDLPSHITQTSLSTAPYRLSEAAARNLPMSYKREQA